jgi:hypothetical protein
MGPSIGGFADLELAIEEILGGIYRPTRSAAGDGDSAIGKRSAGGFADIADYYDIDPQLLEDLRVLLVYQPFGRKVLGIVDSPIGNPIVVVIRAISITTRYIQPFACYRNKLGPRNRYSSFISHGGEVNLSGHIDTISERSALAPPHSANG